ncbi:MAG: hypothetical protein A3K41_13025 [Chloroflexi bacterium RIFOXYD12_FULL_57_15]|nr:MAG: hypothetical protein A3K41_13025 [Chloroflexi bacterium RIFOXYD12_FULL_57_15]
MLLPNEARLSKEASEDLLEVILSRSLKLRTSPSRVTKRQPVPDKLTEGVQIVDRLRQKGVLESLADRVPILRKPGYLVLDSVLYLLYFFCTGTYAGGLREFYVTYRKNGKVLGYLAGRACLMSASAMSRVLQEVDVSSLTSFGQWFLLEVSGAVDVLKSPHVQTRDALGNFWHVLNFDPTRRVYRRRDLPEGTEYPKTRRKTADMAAPGHVGRKRGEVVMSQGMLLHDGSGVWLDASVGKGNGQPRSQFAQAVAAVLYFCKVMAVLASEVLLIADGEFGSVPYLDCAIHAGIAYLTRLSRYDLLDDPKVRERLRTARWERVPDTDSGPTRYATDLGDIAVPPGATTLREDGSVFEPVVVRVVASRYDVKGETKGRGHRIGNDIFEMFAVVGLSQEAWPAAHVVHAYYSRSAQENRFDQVDRELNVDTTFSFTLGGQLLALLCGLFVWNYRIVEGVKRNPLPDAVAEQESHVPDLVQGHDIPDPPELVTPAAPAICESTPAGIAVPDPQVQDKAEGPESPSPAPASVASQPATPDSASTVCGVGTSEEPSKESSLTDETTTVPPDLDKVLGTLHFDQLLRRRPEWKWDPQNRTLIDDNGVKLKLVWVGRRNSVRSDLRFRGVDASNLVAQASISVSREIGDLVKAALPEKRRTTLAYPPQRSTTRPTTPAGPVRPVDRSSWIRKLASDDTPVVPRLIPTWSLFLPAKARQEGRAALREIPLIFYVSSTAMPPRVRHSLLAVNPQERSCTRQTWRNRQGRFARPPGTDVQIASQGATEPANRAKKERSI